MSCYTFSTTLLYLQNNSTSKLDWSKDDLHGSYYQLKTKKYVYSHDMNIGNFTWLHDHLEAYPFCARYFTRFTFINTLLTEHNTFSFSLAANRDIHNLAVKMIVFYILTILNIFFLCLFFSTYILTSDETSFLCFLIDDKLISIFLFLICIVPLGITGKLKDLLLDTGDPFFEFQAYLLLLVLS